MRASLLLQSLVLLITAIGDKVGAYKKQLENEVMDKVDKMKVAGWENDLIVRRELSVVSRRVFGCLTY